MGRRGASLVSSIIFLRGKGVPRVHIMENKLKGLGDREGHDSHLAEHFLKKYYSLPELLPLRHNLAVVTRQKLAISSFILEFLN